jgi:hypothetical protein
MGLITLPKKNATNVSTAKKAVLLSDFAEQIDEVGRLQEELGPIAAQIKELTKRLKPLKDAEARLQELADELEIDDDATTTEHGVEFDAEIGAKGASRSIKDLKGVRKIMGDELFFKVASVTLKDCDAYLTLPQRNQVIETTRTKRSVKVTKRG